MYNGEAHKVSMNELTKEAGTFRSVGVGVFAGKQLVHMAHPANQVPQLIKELVDWAKKADIEQVIEQVTEQVERLLEVIGDKECSTKELMELLGLKHRPTFRDNYLLPALELGYIEMTIPDKPNSSKQKYKKVKDKVK